MDKVIDFIKDRASVLSFTDEPVPRESMMRILDAGRLAPSAKNRQTWRFVVIEDAEMRGKVHEAAYGQENVGQAPSIVAACTTNVDYKMPNGQLSYPIDIAIALAYMTIQAQAEGLGSCIISTYDEARMREIVSVPWSMRVVLMLLVGTPNGEPVQQSRKPLSSIVSFDHW